MIKSVEISNFGNISKAKFDCGKFNIFDGANNQGKTTILNVIEWAIIGGNDDSIIKNGESNCEIILNTDTSVRIERRLMRGGTNKLFVYQNENSLSDPQKVLNKIFNPLLFDPTKLVTMKAKEVNEFISDAISKRLVLSKDQIKHYGLEELDLSADPVIAIKKHYDNIYDLRTVANRNVKTTSTKLDGIELKVDPEEIKNLEELIPGVQAKLDDAKSHNSKLEISKNNLSVKTSTENSVKQLREDLEQIKDIDITLLESEHKTKKAELEALQKENNSNRTLGTSLRDTLAKIGGEIKCPLNNAIVCKTDMSSYKKEMEKKVVQLSTEVKEQFVEIAKLKTEVDELEKKINLYKNINPKKLELERLESLLEQLQIFSGELIDVAPINDELTKKKDRLSKLKMSLEIAKVANLDDMKLEQEKYNSQLDILKELLETVIPNMLKINIKDLTLSKDGIYYRGVLFSKLGDSIKLRLSIAILKDLFPKANIYNMDRLERIDPQGLQKYVDTYANANDTIQYFGAYVGKAPVTSSGKIKVFTLENFTIKGA